MENALNEVQAEFVANLRDYNDLVVLGPHLFHGFEAEDVHHWDKEHPDEAKEIRHREEEETEEEDEVSGEATVVVDEDFSVDNQNNNVVDSSAIIVAIPSPPLDESEKPSTPPSII